MSDWLTEAAETSARHLVLLDSIVPGSVHPDSLALARAQLAEKPGEQETNEHTTTRTERHLYLVQRDVPTRG